MSSRGHAALLVTLVAAFAAALTFCLLRVVIPRAAAVDIPTPPPVGAPMTTHLALVIVDGLRYDLATDPAVMPELARRMREETSGEILASPVSMTSSAVLTYGTGQRGDLDQIVNNESGAIVRYNHLPGNARAAGLTTACTGDHAWFQLYAGAWDLAHSDPDGVAIDVDYNAEIFDATRGFLRHDPRPSFLVAHFVTPDHQAHAYGIHSERYRNHLRAFDATLSQLLASIPGDTTVFLTSDHGATDTGTHGSDTLVQRRSPLVAYGPGIVHNRREGRPLDQVDLPSTFAALLGISAPAHGRGHVLVDWLDLPDARRAEIACRDLARLSVYATATAGPSATEGVGAEEACSPVEPRAQIEAAARAAAALDRRIGEVSAAGSPSGWLVPCLALSGALALASILLSRGRVGLHAVAAGATAGVVAIVLGVSIIFGIERLPGKWPIAAYVAMTLAVHLALLWSVVRARAATAWLDRRAAIGSALVPGLLLVTYTKTTQPESFVVAVVVGAFAVTVGLPRDDGARVRRAMPWRVRPVVVGATVLLVALLAPTAILQEGYLPEALLQHDRLLLAAALIAIALFGVQRHMAAGRAAPHPMLTVAAIAAAGASLVFRRFAPAPICVAGWLGLAAVALAAATKRSRTLVELAALGSYAWVSRDAEIPIVLATYLVATVIGGAAGADIADEVDGMKRRVRPSWVLLLVTFAFAWTYLQRIGVQLGIDFVHLDWGAGAFRDPGASLLRIGAALVYKHAIVRAAILFAILAPLSAGYRVWVARGLLIAELARTAMVVTMLYVSRNSFWTSMRALGDVPHALLATVVAALAYAVVTIRHEHEFIGLQVEGAPALQP